MSGYCRTEGGQGHDGTDIYLPPSPVSPASPSSSHHITLHDINTHPPSNPVTAFISLIIRITVDFPLHSRRTSYTDSASRSILCPLVPANGLFGQDEVTHFDTFVVVSSTTIQDGPSVIS